MTNHFEKITLDNDLRVILTPLPAFRSVTAIVLCGAGSRYETKKTSGMSHFLEHLPLICDMLSDMLWNSKFDQKEIEKERGVIIEEINLYEDTPMRRVAEIYEQ